MSSRLRVSKYEAEKRAPLHGAPRMPISIVRATTWDRNGSDCRPAGNRHGARGSAQPSSIAVGTRLDWDQLANAVTAPSCRATPIAGLSLVYVNVSGASSASGVTSVFDTRLQLYRSDPVTKVDGSRVHVSVR